MLHQNSASAQSSGVRQLQPPRPEQQQQQQSLQAGSSSAGCYSAPWQPSHEFKQPPAQLQADTHDNKRDREDTPREEPSQKPEPGRQRHDKPGSGSSSSAYYSPSKRQPGGTAVLAGAPAALATGHASEHGEAVRPAHGLPSGSGGVLSMLQPMAAGGHTAAALAAGVGPIGAAMAAHGGQQHPQQQQQQHWQTQALHRNPFELMPQMCSHMVQKGVTNEHVMKQLAQLEQDQLCKVVFKGEAGSRPQMQRVYALPGSFGLPPDGPAARDALPSLAKFKELFIKQHQQDRWGFLRVKVDAKPEMGATAALEKLNQYSLLLLTWRLQHHPNLPAALGWLVELIDADGGAAAAAGAGGGGTASHQQRRSQMRGQLDRAQL